MKLGIRSVFYYDSAVNFSTPTWAAISKFRDVSVNAQWDTVEAPDRGSRVKSMAKTLLDIGVSGSLKVSDTDTGVNAVMTALLSPTANIGIMVLNGTSATNGSRGYRYDAIVTQGNEPQNIGDALYLDVNFAPDAFSANNFQSVLVTSGSPAYTNL
jgi:hypothetical protein